MAHPHPQSYQSIAIYGVPAPAQVGDSCPEGCQGIAIYSDPAPAQVVQFKVTNVSLLTVNPLLPLWGIPTLKVTKVMLFAVIPPLPPGGAFAPCYQSTTIYSDPALAPVGYSRFER